MKIIFQTNKILPVATYGGTERIIFWLMCQLKNKGHKPVLIGSPKSKVEDYGIDLIPYDPKENENWEHLIPKDADIIHLSYNYAFKQTDIPCLYTIHGNGQLGEKFPLNSVFVSLKHAQNHNCNSYVYNGINFDEYPITQKRRFAWNKFLFLAKASWRIKDLKSCLRACKRNRKSLNIVGGKSWLPSRYISNHGFLGGCEKNEVIQNSDALLFPVKWEEPFGLAIIESMGFGLPVIGTNYGSLPELINEDSGVICESESQFIETVRCQPVAFSPSKIIEYARNGFSSEIMCSNYIEIYSKVLNGETLNSSQPTWILENPASKALPF